MQHTENVQQGDSSNVSDPSTKGKFCATLICFLLGLGCLFPWAALITILDYYQSLFPHYHAHSVILIIYPPFALISSQILAYYEARISTRKRTLFGFTAFALCTFGLLLIDLVTSGKGGIISFVLICLLVSGYGISEACVEGGMVGDLSFMRPQFVQSFFVGFAGSGVLSSFLRIITLVAFDRTHTGLRMGFMLFLGLCTCFLLACIILYAFWFTRLPIIKHFRTKAALEGCTTVLDDLAAAGVQTSVQDTTSRLSRKELLLRVFDYLLEIFLIHTLTWSIFPGIVYESTKKHSWLGFWYDQVMIGVFNACDMVSRFIPLMKCLTLRSRKGVMIASVFRWVMIPCFYFVVKNGASEGWMVMLIAILGLTNGYFTVCTSTGAPKGHKAPDQNAIGNWFVMALLAGAFSGVALSWLRHIAL